MKLQQFTLEGMSESYARLSVRRPRTLLLAIFSVSLALTLIVGGTGLLFFQDQGGREWDIRGIKEVSQFDALSAARDQLKFSMSRDSSGGIPLRSESAGSYSVSFMFKSHSGDMLTAANLAIARDVEMILLSKPKYASKFCLLKYQDGISLGCDRPSSVLEKFYGPIDPSNPYASPGYSAVLGDVTALASEIRATRDFSYLSLMSAEFNTTGKAKLLRSTIELGRPLEGTIYNEGASVSEDDDADIAFDELLKSFQEDVYKYLGSKAPFLKTKAMAKDRSKDDVEVFFFAGSLYGNEFGESSNLDFFWAVFSAIAVYIYMFIYTRSILICLISIFNNAMGMLVGYFIYRLIFQVTYFAPLHLCYMFIVLGIGADDVFVMFDAFKQSASVPDVNESVEFRVVYTAKRATRTVFVTSATTSIAFFSTGISSLVPISSVGIYGGVVIAVLWLETVLTFPPILTLYGRYFEDLPWYACAPFCLTAAKRDHLKTKRQSASGSAATTMSIIDPEASVKAKPPNTLEVSAYTGDGSDYSTTIREREASRSMNQNQMRSIDRFFSGPWFNIVKKLRYFLVLAALVFIGVGLAFTVQIAPPEKAEQWFTKQHMMQTFINDQAITSKLWPSGGKDDDFSKISLVWGIKGMKTSGLNPWDVEERGTLQYDTTFDMTSQASQSYLLGICPKLRAAPCFVSGCQRPTLVASGDAKCFVEGMQAWLQDTKYPADGTKRLGLLAPSEFSALLAEYTARAATRSEYPEQIGLIRSSDGTKTLRWIRFTATSTYIAPDSLKHTKDVFNEWNDFVDNTNADAPEGIKNAFVVLSDVFTGMRTSENLVYSAVTGLAIVFGMAFAVLNLVTMNIVISLIGVVAIGGIVVTMIGIAMMHVAHWSLGIVESVAVVVLVGFSMDYVLHIAEAYEVSEEKTREDRTRDALAKLGSSVTSGCFTNVLCAVFLFGATFSYFYKFGFIVLAVAIISIVWALLFLPAALLFFGPVGHVGDWPAAYRWLKRRNCFVSPDPSAKIVSADHV